MILEKELMISSNHPALEGHFPGHPVVPGVVILDEIFSLILEHDDELMLDTVSHVKFLHPLAPERRFQITINLDNIKKVTVECYLDGRVIVKAKLVLTRQGDAA